MDLKLLQVVGFIVLLVLVAGIEDEDLRRLGYAGLLLVFSALIENRLLGYVALVVAFVVLFNIVRRR